MKYREDLNITVDSSQDQLLRGTLLGDASCIVQKGAKNPYVRVGHSLKDIGYTEWKHNFLSPSGLLQSPVDKYGSFNTIQHPALSMYPELRTTKIAEGRKFFELVDPYIPDCMARKKWGIVW